jgi:hypothetical protein
MERIKDLTGKKKQLWGSLTTPTKRITVHY